MATSDPFGLGKFVPGFDFLQSLSKQATQNIPQLPNVGNWIAPTLNVDELDKRLEDLKQVQFWLDQNATALAAVIQALEVQKMTLTTLKDMNFNLGDVANAFKLRAADAVMGGVGKAVDAARSFTGEAPAKVHGEKNPSKSTSKSASKSAFGAARQSTTPTALPDPAQWWGSLSKQFADIASGAMKEASQKTAMDAAKNMASEFAKGGIKAAQSTASQMGKAAADLAGALPRGAGLQNATKNVATKAINPLAKAQKAAKKVTKRAVKTPAAKSATPVKPVRRATSARKA